jgi:hypothetical protein
MMEREVINVVVVVAVVVMMLRASSVQLPTSANIALRSESTRHVRIDEACQNRRGMSESTGDVRIDEEGRGDLRHNRAR